MIFSKLSYLFFYNAIFGYDGTVNSRYLAKDSALFLQKVPRPGLHFAFSGVYQPIVSSNFFKAHF